MNRKGFEGPQAITIDGVSAILFNPAKPQPRWVEPPESAYHATGISNGFDVPGVAMDDNLARIAAWPLSFPPGAAWNYSVATDVLGAALSAAVNTESEA